MIIIGIILEAFAAALGTTSKQLIAYSEHVHKPWISHLGAGINIAVGPLVDASAYAFAPQVVVAPFACLDVIFNALTAPYTLSWQHEELSRVHFLATGLVATGAVFTAVFGSVHDDLLSVYQLEAQLTKLATVVYLLVEIVGIVVITLCMQAKVLSKTVRGIALGVMAGILMGNVFFVKGFIMIVREWLTTGNAAAWHRPTPYLLIGLAALGSFGGFVFMRQGLAEYKGVFMVTIFEGAHITAACLSGCIVMSEMAHAPWWQYVLYWMSVLTIVAGMVLINTAAMDSNLERSLLSGSEKQQLGEQVQPLLHATQYRAPDESGREVDIKSCRVEAARTPCCEQKSYLARLLAFENVIGYQADSNIEEGNKDQVVFVKQEPEAEDSLQCRRT